MHSWKTYGVRASTLGLPRNIIFPDALPHQQKFRVNKKLQNFFFLWPFWEQYWQEISSFIMISIAAAIWEASVFGFSIGNTGFLISTTLSNSKIARIFRMSGLRPSCEDFLFRRHVFPTAKKASLGLDEAVIHCKIALFHTDSGHCLVLWFDHSRSWSLFLLFIVCVLIHLSSTLQRRLVFLASSSHRRLVFLASSSHRMLWWSVDRRSFFGWFSWMINEQSWSRLFPAFVLYI